MPMTDEEFETLVKRSMNALNRKQSALTKNFSLGRYARWWYDQDTRLLQFQDSQGRVCVEAEVIEIGSYSTQSKTWLWAWANPSVDPEQRLRSASLKELTEITGLEIFQMESFPFDEHRAWELAGLAVRHLKAKGCYRAPTDHLQFFLAIDEIRSVS